MFDPLVTYVNDHLGGAQVAVQLLEAMRNQQGDQEFRQFASVLLPEIQADDLVLRRIAEKIASSPNTIKQLGDGFLRKPRA
jgi:NMD protein affecting ribosome stability and mRNA decay